jgi:hypothetical protein
MSAAQKLRIDALHSWHYLPRIVILILPVDYGKTPIAAFFVMLSDP